MPENKKVEETKKAETATSAPAKGAATETPKTDDTPKDTNPAGARTPADQPADAVKPPSVEEVKNPVQPANTENIEKRVEAVKKSVEDANKSNEEVKKAEPFVAPKKDLPSAPMAEERLNQQVERVKQSVEEFNKSAKIVAEATPDNADEVKPVKETSRVAPLTGELRPDPEDDSFVTPGKTLQPPPPKPGEPEPEFAPAPLVIAPLSGEIKPEDETSYPTPGRVRDPNAVNTEPIRLSTKQSKYGVPEGQQVPLLQANQEYFANDAAIREQNRERAMAIAESIVSADGLRRTRRAQKSLR